jgi:putative serine protease PepD
MSTREGLEPSRSQDSDTPDPDTHTRLVPDSPDSDTQTRPLGQSGAAGTSPNAPSDQPWPPSWGPAASSWGQAPAPAAGQAPAPAAGPAWTPPPGAQGPSWTQPTGPETQANAPEAPADQTQPGSGQGGGYPTVPAWGAPPAEAGSPGGRRPARWLAAVVAGVVLLATGYGISQALDNNTPAGAGIPTAAPIAAAPVPSGEEPAAAVAKALLPTVVEISHDNGLGSGFVYDSNGYIMTAAHVVQGVDQVDVRLYDGTKLTGRVVGTDDRSDVAVVKIDRTGLKAAPLATGKPAQVGQLAVAIGSPFGLNETVTAGIVSATDRVLNDGREVLQTDAPINPGNSGGLLANRQGQVIGINDAIRPGDNGSDGNVGIGFAIPIDVAAKSAAAIVQGKQVQSGYLGISVGDAPNGQNGAVVQDVASGSPAAKAGLQVGDQVTAIDGQAVQSSADMVAAIRDHKPGDKVTITVNRNGSQTTISATLGERPGG